MTDNEDEVTRGAAALIVVPEWHSQRLSRDLDARAEEARGLALAIGLDVVSVHMLRLRQTRAATLLGVGQIEAITPDIAAHGVQLVVVDASLTAIQQRNLETAFGTKVIDRTGLILEIFGERAATAEGRMQVELAHLDYQAGRLVRSWTHLERQRGGFGFLGGPGETQIEADRRMIRNRMARIRRSLEDARRTRQLQRSKRQRAPWPVIALVGYTNAGKSTFFNCLTGSSVMAEDMLFATLDPTMREISLPGIDKAILSDTVGFVSDLPTQLVAAFRATLEEVTTADLIVHVRDIVHPDSDAQYDDVRAILDSLGVNGPQDGEGGKEIPDTVPQIEIWNKIDTADADRRAQIEEMAARRSDVALISAATGEGVEAARILMASQITARHETQRIFLAFDQGEAMAWLHARGEVLSDEVDGEGHILTVRLDPADTARFERLWPVRRAPTP
ncbi:GTP-binding protein HflX [Sphingopyxis panaciterrae]|uniref:GTPase HflX n=1 Tax=Sphingopyxis panaciterrae TaxID=363841 RepID=UPI00141FFC23|nr:GTPase HflX [Sphingopyxis panaciterrae]NIJ36926.1 GTP-binding protein HflX [Sphingopyxis panaciterrae]